MKKNKLVWRLGKLPTVSELQELVKDKIITHEEAREVLFKTEIEEEGRDTDSYKEEIKFLRELVEKLSTKSRSTVVEYIYTKPYNGIWYQPYVNWCSTGEGNLQSQQYANNTGTMSNAVFVSSQGSNFTDVSTF